jgi:hypothetical protein
VVVVASDVLFVQRSYFRAPLFQKVSQSGHPLLWRCYSVASSTISITHMVLAAKQYLHTLQPQSNTLLFCSSGLQSTLEEIQILAVGNAATKSYSNGTTSRPHIPTIFVVFSTDPVRRPDTAPCSDWEASRKLWA